MRKTREYAGWACGLALAITMHSAVASTSETGTSPAARNFQTYQPDVRPVRIDAAAAPKIDGDLSDAAWQKAPVISEFYQLEPNEGAPASERTEVRILYDENNLYFAVKAFDSDPAGIKASIKARDGQLGKDDLIRIYLDPQQSRRDGYAFEINPLGARTDALVQNNSTFLVNWDTIWHAHSRIVSDGWVTEVAIPFRSISYDSARTDWGFDFFRLVRRKNERIRWSQISRQMTSVDISRSGSMLGITGTHQGLGLDIETFGAMRFKHEWEKPRESDLTFEPSGNLFYKLTPSLTGTLTFNTDFSDTPLDDRQVNTGRFGLFFPETRDFFLQDAAVFEFGGDNLNGDVNGIPFFSRNIGLVNGRPVDIVAGGKVSGQLGKLGLGGLLVHTSGTETTDGQTLAAARITQQVLDQSKIGIVFTNGDPTGATENTVAGADFQYRNSTWFDGDTLKADFFYERSFSNVYGDDDTFGATISFPNEPFSMRHSFKEVGENFFPALGFVNRGAIRNYNGEMEWREVLNGETFIRWWEVGTWYDVTTDLGNNLESRENGIWGGFLTQSVDSAFFNVFNSYENVLSPFELPKGVIVPAGEYEWTNATLSLESSASRPISLNVEVACCSFFGGDRLRTFAAMNWRPNSTLDIGLQHQFQNISLPTGDVEIQIYAMNLSINFTPDMQLRTQVQYDNISETFGLSSRYRWEFDPGSELFVSLGESGELLNGNHYRSDTTQASIRIGHLMRM